MHLKITDIFYGQHNNVKIFLMMIPDDGIPCGNAVSGSANKYGPHPPRGAHP